MDRRTATFLGAGLLIALVLAGVVSGFGSSEPDGLERVAIDKGLDETADDHPLAGSPLADYGVEGVENERLGTGLAGVLGVVITLVAVVTVLYGVRAVAGRRRTEQ